MSGKFLIYAITNLDKNGEKNNRYRCSYEKRLTWDAIWIDEEDQSEGDSSTQSTIRHNKLFHSIELMKAEVIR